MASDDVRAGASYIEMYLKKSKLTEGLEETESEVDASLQRTVRKFRDTTAAGKAAMVSAAANKPAVPAPSAKAGAPAVQHEAIASQIANSRGLLSDFGEQVKTMMAAVKAASDAVTEGIAKMVTAVNDSAAAMARLTKVAVQSSAGVHESGKVTATYTSILNKVLPLVDEFVSEMIELGTIAYEIVSILPTMTKGVINLYNAVKSFFQTDLGKFMLGCADAAYTLAKGMMAIIQPLTLITNIAFALPNAFAAAFGVIMSGFRLIKNAIIELPGLVLKAAKGIASATYSMLTTIGTAVVSTVRVALTSLLSVVRSIATTAAKIAMNPGKMIVAPITNWATGAINSIRNAARAIGDYIQSIAIKVAKVGAAITGMAGAVIVPLTAAAREFAQVGTEAKTLADKVGLSVAAVRELGYAAKSVGASQADIGSAVKHATKEVDDTKPTDVKGLNQIWRNQVQGGIEAFNTDALKQLEAMNPEQRFIALATAINKLEKASDRAKAATIAFGESGEALLPLIEKGPAGINHLRQEAQALGLSMSGPAAAAAAALTAAFTHLKDATSGLWMTVGTAVAPIITEMTERMVAVIKVATKWARENQGLIATIFKVASTVATVGTVLLTVAGAISGIASIFGGFAAVAGTVAAVVATVGGAIAAVLTPMAALIALAAGTAIYFGRALPIARMFNATVEAGGTVWGRFAGSVGRAIDSAMNSMRRIVAFTSRVFSGVHDAIRAGNLELAIDVLWTGATVAWAKGLNSIADLTGGTIGRILNLLASGKWSTAADAAWKSIQIVSTQGLSILESLWTATVAKIGSVWSGLEGVFDTVMTYLRQGWNTTLQFMSDKLLALGRSIAKLLDAASKIDPTGALKGARKDLNKELESLSSFDSKSDNAKLDQDLANRQASREYGNAQNLAASDETAMANKAKRDIEIANLLLERARLLQGAGGVSAEHQQAQETKLNDLIAAAAAARAAATPPPTDQAAIDKMRKARLGADTEAVFKGTNTSAGGLAGIGPGSGGRGAPAFARGRADDPDEHRGGPPQLDQRTFAQTLFQTLKRQEQLLERIAAMKLAPLR